MTEYFFNKNSDGSEDIEYIKGLLQTKKALNTQGHFSSKEDYFNNNEKNEGVKSMPLDAIDQQKIVFLKNVWDSVSNNADIQNFKNKILSELSPQTPNKYSDVREFIHNVTLRLESINDELAKLLDQKGNESKIEVNISPEILKALGHGSLDLQGFLKSFSEGIRKDVIEGLLNVLDNQDPQSIQESIKTWADIIS